MREDNLNIKKIRLLTKLFSSQGMWSCAIK